MSSGMNKIGQGSWEQERLGVRRNFQRIASTVLGPNSTPPFANVYLTDLTANALIYPDTNKLLTSATYLTTSGTTLDIAGKVTVGSQTSPQDVTATRQYGFELHYSGNNYNVTGIRSRAQLVTTDASTKTALGGLFQAANNDGIDAGVLMGFMAEAIGKSTSNASTITTMRGGLIGTEWGALDAVTNLKTLHIRGHSRNAAGAGSFGTGYALYIENEAVGGNGQAYDAGIYFKDTNLSAGNKAFTYGIDFSGGSYGTAEIKLSSGGNIDMNAGRLWSSSGNILIQPSSTYKIIIQPTTDSTTFFQINDQDGNNEFTIDTINNALLFGYTKLGTIEGSYNFINGTAFASKSGYTYCVAVGTSIVSFATGNVWRNNLIGSTIANAATGNVYYNNIVGHILANAATQHVSYNNIVGNILANAATGSVQNNNLVGFSLACSATGNVNSNNIVGSTIANVATGNVLGNYIVGNTLVNSITGNVLYNFVSGYHCIYNTTNETDLERVIAFPYESLSGSSASDLDNAIAIGYQTGLNNAYNNPGLFGTQAVADAHKQIVLGSAYYTGGLRLYGADFRASSATPYFTLHNSTHEDTDGGGEVRIIGKREDGAGTETVAGQIEISHDGSGANDQYGKIVEYVNTGAGLVEVRRSNSAGNFVMANDRFIALDTNAGITASTTQSQGQGALTAQINEIFTVANDGDTVTLPSAVTGVEIEIINNGANTLRIFPASGDDLGLGTGATTSFEELEPNERVKFVAYDTTNWAKESTTEIIHAEMFDYDNTDAYTVNAASDAHMYHTNGMQAGDLADWTFDAGGAGISHAIASIADGADSGVDIAVTTSDNHLLAIGDIISQTNLTSAVYTGTFIVKDIISPTIYEVEAVYTATDTGTMDQAATLEADAVAAGQYLMNWSASAAGAGANNIFDFAIHVGATHINSTNIRRKFGGAGDVGAMSGVSIIAIADGDKVSFMITNTSGSGNITLRDFTLVLVRL